MTVLFASKSKTLKTNSNQNMNSSTNMKVDIESTTGVLARDSPESSVLKDEHGSFVGDITSNEKLKYVPEKYLSGDPKRPLSFTDEHGNTYTYLLRPTFQCVIMILLLECCERFAFYGVTNTMTDYLTGYFNEEWNAGLSADAASSYTALGTSVAYALPFLGAILADGFLGTFKTIAIATILVYIPGLFLIAVSAKPYLFAEFNNVLLSVAYYGMYSAGAGCIKSCVNVLGASQFHPVLQTGSIATYYVRFYAFINIGALLGGIVIPLVLQKDSGDMQFKGYMIPPCILLLGYIIFMVPSGRYIKPKPGGSVILESIKAACSSLTSCPPSLAKQTVEMGGKYKSSFVANVGAMGHVFVLMVYTIPFSIIYSQMTGIFVIQANAMKTVGPINSSFLSNFDALSVLLAGVLIGNVLFPLLQKRGIVLSMMTKFAIGSIFPVVGVLFGILIDHMMKSQYAKNGGSISILWMGIPYGLIGFGEVFVYSTSYELAFTLSPEGFKAFGSAINLLFIGCISNLLVAALLNACDSMTENLDDPSAKIQDMKDYSKTRFNDFYWILVGIGLLGVIAPALPWSRRYYNYCLGRAEKLQQGIFE